MLGFPGDGAVKNPPASSGDTGLIPGSGRSPVVGHGNLPQYSCLENFIDRGAWQATVHAVTKGRTQVSRHKRTCIHVNPKLLIYPTLLP